MKSKSICKLLVLLIAIIFFISLLPITNANTIVVKKKFDSKEQISFLSDDLVVDLKVRKQNSDGNWSNWQDENINADVGTILEFKIYVNSIREDGHYGVSVTVLLPEVDGNPMLNYVFGSASDILNLLAANDEEVTWYYLSINPGDPKELTFKARISIKGSQKQVRLEAFSIIPDTWDDPSIDTLYITSSKTKQPDVKTFILKEKFFYRFISKNILN
jgi:hypothetical protein